jgi:threonine/homoserine/homoserine lactone efflux protein
MLLEYIWKGIVVGLSASIPLGPIGVLCIQRTLNKGRVSGFVSGFGAAAADGLFAIIAGFGISIIIDSVVEYQLYLKAAGGIILFVMGIRLLYANPAIDLRRQLKKKKKGLFGDFLSIFILTISNPIGVFVFIAVFAGFDLVVKDSTASVLVLVAGVLLGAALWWFALSGFVSLFRHKFRLRKLLLVNRIAGVLVIAFGLLVVVSIFWG